MILTSGDWIAIGVGLLGLVPWCGVGLVKVYEKLTYKLNLTPRGDLIVYSFPNASVVMGGTFYSSSKTIVHSVRVRATNIRTRETRNFDAEMELGGNLMTPQYQMFSDFSLNAGMPKGTRFYFKESDISSHIVSEAVFLRREWIENNRHYKKMALDHIQKKIAEGKTDPESVSQLLRDGQNIDILAFDIFKSRNKRYQKAYQVQKESFFWKSGDYSLSFDIGSSKGMFTVSGYKVTIPKEFAEDSNYNSNAYIEKVCFGDPVNCSPDFVCPLERCTNE